MNGISDKGPHWKSLNSHQKWAQPTASKENKTVVVQGQPVSRGLVTHTPRPPPTELLEGHCRPPSQSLKNTCSVSQLSCTIQDPAKGVELVQCSTARTKTSTFLLKLRFDYPLDAHLHNPWIDLTRDAHKYDPPIVRHTPTTTTLFLKRRKKVLTLCFQIGRCAAGIEAIKVLIRMCQF